MATANRLSKAVKSGITAKVKKKPTQEEIEARIDHVLFCCDGVDQVLNLAKVDIWDSGHTPKSRLESAKKALLHVMGWIDGALAEVDDHSCRFVAEADRVWRAFVGHYEEAALYYNGQSKDPRRAEFLPNRNWVRVALVNVVRKRVEKKDRDTINAFRNWGFGNPMALLDPARFLSVKEQTEGHIPEIIEMPEVIDLNINPFDGTPFILERS